MNDIKFIRKNGRIIPIKQKSYVGKKTVESGAADRALRGLKKGAAVGAGIGVVAGTITAFSGGHLGHVFKGAANLGLLGGLLGSGLTTAFGSRKKQIKVSRKKWSSV
jgi:hypothetical protein